jgi:hypothetical protein
MSHISAFRNAYHHADNDLPSNPAHISLLGWVLDQCANVMSRKIEALAKRLADHRQRVDRADLLSGMDDRMLEDIGLDHDDMRLILARARRERRYAANSCNVDTLS